MQDILKLLLLLVMKTTLNSHEILKLLPLLLQFEHCGVALASNVATSSLLRRHMHAAATEVGATASHMFAGISRTSCSITSDRSKSDQAVNEMSARSYSLISYCLLVNLSA